MIRHQRKTDLQTACMAVLLACICMFAGQTQAAPADITQSEITTLQQDFAEISTQTSAAKKRRSCKTIVRKGASLIKASPTAPNRFQALSIMFETQKLLLTMDNTERTRKALFEVCAKLVDAPDTYAEIRLEADLLLSNMKLASKNASNPERIEALPALIAQYRGTPGEAKCLVIASQIAAKLEAPELVKTIITTMGERFAGDPTIVEFRLKNLGLGRIEVPFTGVFKRADGTTLSFPVDQLGHASIMVFWSQQTPGYQEALKQINEQTSVYAGQLSVFSFNVDELPDAGEKQLRGLGLDWTAMHLPDGKNSRAFRIFGREKPVGYLVSPYGQALLLSGLAKYGHGHGAITEVMISEKTMPHRRYLAQLQSLFIGDFLVSDASDNPAADSLPQEKVAAIQACFTPAPMRYRLSPEQALADYSKAEKISRETINQFPKATDLWRVRNYRIIALLGMWKLTIEPKHLDAALKEAQTSLSTTLPQGAAVVPQFCLAKSALRQDGVDANSTLAEFIKACGGDDAPASAYAAAAILALDAHSKDLHQYYRQKFFESSHGSPKLWPLVSYLRDQYHKFHLLRAIDTRRERRESRSNLINHRWNVSSIPFPASELKTLDGETLSLPKDTQGKLTLVLFVEPPANPDAEIPLEITGKLAEGKKKAVVGTIGQASQLANNHLYKELNLVIAFLSDDPDRIKALVKKHGWTCQIAMVPGGVKNPLTRQLGILSADHMANIFLLRRDGTIAWHTSGLEHQGAFSHSYSAFLGMGLQIELCDIALAYKSLEQGDFKKSAHLFAGPFPKKKDERFRWSGPRFHGRALANMKLKQWDTALEDIDKAIADHNPKRFRHKKGHPCDSMLEMLTIRSLILENLGQTTDAKVAKKLASTEPTAYPKSIYEEFHEKLKELRQQYFPQ